MAKISFEELAELTGYGVRHIYKLAEEKLFHASGGKCDAVESLSALVRHARQPGDLAAEKLAKLKAERELKEVELAEARRELVPVDDLRKAFTGLRVASKAKLVFYLLNQAPQRNDGLGAAAQRENNQKLLTELLNGMADAEEQFFKGETK